MVYPGEGRGSRGTTTAEPGGKSDGKTIKLKVAYRNVDGLLSSIVEIKDYLSTRCVLHDGNKIEGRDQRKFPARGI